jgi:hypothetical protein
VLTRVTRDARLQPEPLANDGDKHVDRDGDPDLGLHGILAGAEECLDSQMMLDPFEEELSADSMAVRITV